MTVRSVAERKPVMAFLEWEGASAVKGHFVVIGRAEKATGRVTALDPMFGMREFFGNGLPCHYPSDTNSLILSGAIIALTQERA